MKNRMYRPPRYRAAGWALFAGVLLLLTSPVPASADRESPPSRHSPPETRASGGGTPRVAVPRSPSGSARTPSSRHARPAHGSGGRRHSGRVHVGGHYGYGSHYRIGLGLYWPGSYYGHYGYGWPYYYPWGWGWYPVGYPHYPRYVADAPQGAIDLNVRPKDTEVWVDGELVGKTGRFDGFPGYLWLPVGSHELVFYRPGYVTVARQLTVRPAMIGDVKFRLAEGESLPPEQVASKPPGKPLDAASPAAGEAKAPPPDSVASAPRPAERPAAGRTQIDLRSDPGRLLLQVVPADASVYLDGRFLGSGEELARLHAGMMVDPGEHVLEVARPGYETRRVEFAVGPGEETELSVELESDRTAVAAPGR